MSLFVASARPELFNSTHQTSITSDFGGMNPREADISRRLHALRIRVYALRQGLFIRSEWLRLRANCGGKMQTRRRFLRSVGAGAALGVAGRAAFSGERSAPDYGAKNMDDAER